MPYVILLKLAIIINYNLLHNTSIIIYSYLNLEPNDQTFISKIKCGDNGVVKPNDIFMSLEIII